MTTYALDVAPLLEAGTSPAAVAARLGIAPGSVGRALAREGRPDLARPFWREAHHGQTVTPGVCSCGAATSRQGRTRCTDCAARARRRH